ncbi:hypothetical protein OPIT5_13525 [Opitutaceae bacterium TAV5]|nr:hypothetical protein OPIT5_13525 [Opitutaceae bacterium TAV5]
MPATITIKELHAKTGEHVRLAGKAKTPTPITDRGRLIAVLAPVSAMPGKRRRRVVLPEYAALLKKAGHAASVPGGDVLDDLDAVRGER